MAADPDEATGAALVASMAGGAKSVPAPADPDEAAGIALVKSIAARVKPVTPEPTGTDAAGYPEWTTEGGAVIGGVPPGPALNIAAAGVKGAIEGFGNPLGQTILSPEAQAILDARQRQGGVGGALAGLGSTVATDIGTAGGMVLGAGNALLRGAQGAVAQTGAELGAPQLGRDVAAIPEAFAGSPNMLARVVPTELPPQLRPFRAAEDGNLLANVPRATDRPAVPAPPNALDPNYQAPEAAIVGPQSVGAAASRDLSNPAAIMMTPAETAAYAATAEGQKLIEPQPVGVPDKRELVPGVTASTAEIEQTVNAAREAKTTNIEQPVVSQAARETAAENNDARQQYLASVVKSPVDVNNAIEARSAQAESDLAGVWKNKTEADAQPVIDAANDIKASPDGRRPVVRSAVDAVTKELYDPDGKLITDPEQLYGVRKHIDDLLSKEAGATDPKSIRAAANLQQLKTALDGVIEPAAPGFTQYLKNFADASKPIDEMQVLQGHQGKLYDTQGRMQLSRVQTMMRNIVDSRAAPGINPYKSISDDTMAKLWNLRDDLRRSASAQELARTPGSDTSQTMFDLAKRGIAAGGDLAAHSVAHHFAPIVGPIVWNSVKAGIANKRAAGAQASAIARGLHNLNPNRLVPPED